MSEGCEGLSERDTASCRECHESGGTWVIRPDGSQICSHATTYTGSLDTSGYTNRSGTGTALLLGLLGFAATIGTGMMD